MGAIQAPGSTLDVVSTMHIVVPFAGLASFLILREGNLWAAGGFVFRGRVGWRGECDGAASQPLQAALFFKRPNKTLQSSTNCDEITTNMKSNGANKTPVKEPDASASYSGSIGIIVPFSQAALAWLKENCITESWQWDNDILHVEDRRMMEDIVQGMESAKFVVSR